MTIQEIAQALLQMDKVAILCHQSPDGDTLGSGFALWGALKQLGKSANVYCADAIGERFSHLVTGYVEEDFVPALTIAVDVADHRLLGALGERFPAVDYCIDHHPSNTKFAAQTYLEGDTGATCEVLYKIFGEMQVQITPQIANCLFTGLVTDTGCFRFPSTKPFTHMMAADLMEKGADSAYLCKLFFGTKTKEYLHLERLVMDSLSYHFENKVAIVCATDDMLSQSGATAEDYDAIASIPAQIAGVEIGVTIKQKGQGAYKLSVRTHGPYLANEICKQLGGGGHTRAAGCAVSGSLAQVKEKALGVIEAYMKQVERA